MKPDYETHRFVPKKIEIKETDLLDRWCRALGVTRYQLTSAVASVGTNPDLVRRHLKCGSSAAC